MDVGLAHRLHKDSLDQVPQVKVTSVSMRHCFCELTSTNTCRSCCTRSQLFLESTDASRFAPYLKCTAFHPFIYLFVGYCRIIHVGLHSGLSVLLCFTICE